MFPRFIVVRFLRFNGVACPRQMAVAKAERTTIMKLKIRYENEIQTIELDAKATEEMWVSLSLEGEGLSQKEREELIQKEWNEQFNKDDYNNCNDCCCNDRCC